MSNAMSRFRMRELRLRNYRAFADVRLKLDDVTFLVGRNGSGKSTLLDGFSFISEALTDSLATALERRGNLDGVRRRSAGRSEGSMAAAIVFERNGRRGIYGFQVGPKKWRSGYEVEFEWLLHGDRWVRRDRDFLDMGGKQVVNTWMNNETGGGPPLWAPEGDTLALPMVPTSPVMREIREGLNSISFQQLVPSEIQAEPNIGSEERLNRSGGNAGDVLKRTKPKDRAWIAERLGLAVPGIRDVRATARAGRRVIVFDQESGGAGRTSSTPR